MGVRSTRPGRCAAGIPPRRYADTPIRRYGDTPTRPLPLPGTATSAFGSGCYGCMKITPLRSVTIALIAAAVASSPSITQAAKPTPTPAPMAATPTRKQAPETADQRLADLKKEVTLTKAQEGKVKPIIEKYVSDRNAVTSDSTLPKSDKNSKKETLRTKYNQDINAILTPDQQQKWAGAKKEMFQPAKQTVAASPSPSVKKK
jgi:Spy/CpxP family protein refolding chaperone